MTSQRQLAAQQQLDNNFDTHMIWRLASACPAHQQRIVYALPSSSATYLTSIICIAFCTLMYTSFIVDLVSGHLRSRHCIWQLSCLLHTCDARAGCLTVLRQLSADTEQTAAAYSPSLQGGLNSGPSSALTRQSAIAARRTRAAHPFIRDRISQRWNDVSKLKI